MQREWPTTKNELEKLYHGDYLNDKQIAALFGVSAFTIWRTRKELGIKGLNPKKRDLILHPQPDFTGRQKSIIFGTLLGDACLKANSNSSAYLSIGHSSTQKDYIFWLYDNLQTVCPSKPKPLVDKKGYTTYYMISQSRADLLDMRGKIYPNGQKTLSAWWLDQVDALSLAVWYMDDGSLAYLNKVKSSFGFATNGFSVEENYLLQAMLFDKFGICSEVKSVKRPTGQIQHTLGIADKHFSKFADTVEPHIPPCMTRKLPSDAFRSSLIDNIETVVDSEKLNEMYHGRKMTQQEIARELGTSVGTVRKYMDVLQVEKRNSIAAQRKGWGSRAVRDSDSGRYASGNWSEDEKSNALQIFREMRRTGFPYPQLKEDDYYVSMIGRLFSFEPELDNDEYKYGRIGSKLSTDFCPQIFSMATRGSMTPEQIYADDKLFLDCILRTGRYAKKSSVSGVRSGLKTYRSNRCVSVFQPSWAVTAIRKMLQGKSGARILDFSSGFGGRLAGSYCSGIVSEYVGIDPLGANIASCEKLNGIIQRHASLVGKQFSCKMIHGTAEDILPTLDGQFDMAITSPPYFDKEIYSADQMQCYNRFHSYGEWVAGWLEPVLKTTLSMVSPGGSVAIFATDDGSYRSVGKDCRRILQETLGNVMELRFALPSLEYLRNKGSHRVESAWVAVKP